MENINQSFLKNYINPELLRVGTDLNTQLSHIRSKDGVHLFRSKRNGESCVLKYFEKDEYKREIENYRLLTSLGIKTIDVIAQTERSLLLCDIESSEKYRLGTKEDLDDEIVSRKIADWYKSLHEKGAGVKEIDSLYSETANFNFTELELLKQNLGKKGRETIDFLASNFEKIKTIVDSFPKTLTYNDFFWTNLIVSYDKSEAFMFDYNLLGTGYRYSDIRNVSYSLSLKAKNAFCDAYGKWDEGEEIADSCISAIITLIFAFKRQKFPLWGRESLNLIENGNLLQRAGVMIDKC